MPALQAGGIRIFSASSIEQLESIINGFLVGDGTVEDPQKILTQAPQFQINGGVFYALITFKPVS